MHTPACVWEWGWGYDKRNVLSILSRGDVLKGTLFLINAWTFCGFVEIKREAEKKICFLLALSQTLLALGSTSSMRDVLYLVSFPICYSQLREIHWWWDQQQSLTIYPRATPSYSCAKEFLITTAGDSEEAAKLAKAYGRAGLWFSGLVWIQRKLD